MGDLGLVGFLVGGLVLLRLSASGTDKALALGLVACAGPRTDHPLGRAWQNGAIWNESRS
ncbi:MAG: hypothetical protein HQL57_04800 [Magnetococcales bacterium]|nr:hypothetical protein [Magnetococcales bacterium]